MIRTLKILRMLKAQLESEASRLGISSTSWKKLVWRHIRKLAIKHAGKEVMAFWLSLSRDLVLSFGWWGDQCRLQLSMRAERPLLGEEVSVMYESGGWLAMGFVDEQRYEREVRAPLKRLHPNAVWGEALIRYEYDLSEDRVVAIDDPPRELWWARTGVNLWWIVVAANGSWRSGSLSVGTAISGFGRVAVIWRKYPRECSLDDVANGLGMAQDALVELLRMEAKGDHDAACAAMML